jgi:biotin synthase
MTNYQQLADKSLRGETLTREEAHAVLDTPAAELENLLQATLRVREYYFARRVKVCVLLNAQSGICPEDCNYCSQSKISKAEVEKYKLLPEDSIVEGARAAAETGARRFCIVIAARGPQQRDIERLSAATRRIKSDPLTAGMEICTSLGLMNLQQCQELKDAGVDYVNHNLNTSEEHYAKICTTHTYADRVETLGNIQAAGLKTCSGGIVGMGETPEDIVEMGFKLRSMDIESIPINFLLTIPGTPLQSLQAIDPSYGLKVLCLMRLLNPDKEVRVAAGRETHLRGRQEKALYAANSLFVDGYLTTPGQASKDVRNWIEAAGFTVEGTQMETAPVALASPNVAPALTPVAVTA